MEMVQWCRNFPPWSLLHLCISQLVLFIQSSFCLRPRFRPKVTYFCSVWALREGRKLLHSVQNVAEMDGCMTALSFYSVYRRLKLKTLQCLCVYARLCASAHWLYKLTRWDPRLVGDKDLSKNVNTLWSGERGSCSRAHTHIWRNASPRSRLSGTLFQDSLSLLTHRLADVGSAAGFGCWNIGHLDIRETMRMCWC